jgi:hypothetical protein
MLCGPLVVHAAPQSKTIDLVISEWHFALYETPAKTECPDGFQYKSVDNYLAEYPTPQAREAREKRFGYDTNQGPHGENTYYFPQAINDPLPFRDAKGDTAIGLNLDGDQTGQGTATPCRTASSSRRMANAASTTSSTASSAAWPAGARAA